jgi:hypothetical protein
MRVAGVILRRVSGVEGPLLDRGKDYIAGEEACDVVALSERLEDGANEIKPPRGGLQNDALVCRWARANNTI